VTRAPAPPLKDFASLAEALRSHAEHLARARAAERRAGDAKWRAAPLLWPAFGKES
jgi:hypothetical protein